MADLWTFDRFTPGATLGAMTIALDAQRLDLARQIYGDDGPGALETVLVAAMMQAYIETIQPRPPGNVHIGQHLVFLASVRAGDHIAFHLSCAAKERRGDSRRVTFGVTAHRNDLCVMTGEIRSIWAA